jgi:small subunit ribosomal protein S14
MAHVNSVYKHMLFVNICGNREVSSMVLKSLFKDRGLDNMTRSRCLFTLIQIGGEFSFVFIRRRCLFTARGRGIISNLYLGRNIFKKLASNGQLVGFVKF